MNSAWDPLEKPPTTKTRFKKKKKNTDVDADKLNLNRYLVS